MITEYRIRHRMGIKLYPTLEAAKAAAAQWHEMSAEIEMTVESRQCTPWKPVGPPDPRRGDPVVIVDHRDFGGRTGSFVEPVLKSAGGQADRVYWRVKLDAHGRSKARLHDFVPSLVKPVEVEA